MLLFCGLTYSLKMFLIFLVFNIKIVVKFYCSLAPIEGNSNFIRFMKKDYFRRIAHVFQLLFDFYLNG